MTLLGHLHPEVYRALLEKVKSCIDFSIPTPGSKTAIKYDITVYRFKEKSIAQAS
jgi:hypothetical protein